MDKELILKKHKRNALRLNTNKEIAKCIEFLLIECPVEAQKFQTTISKLIDYRERLDTLNNDIILHIEGELEATEEMSKAMELDDILLENISALTAKLNASKNTATHESANNLMASEHSGSLNSLNPSGRRQNSVQLPKLQLTKFGGDPIKWTEFWDSFSTTIHDNSDLADVEKFKYLRSFLLGDALRLVDGYRLTSANYTEAVESLRERFGNTQLAVFSHFEAMLSLPVANHDTQQLQTIYDDCEKHIRSLVALGLGEETFSQVFTPIILSKLPMYVKMELHRRNGSKPWELSNLREWLKDEIRVREYSQRTFGGSPSTSGATIQQGQRHGHNIDRTTHRSQPQLQHRKSGGYPSTSAALITNDAKPKLQCGFCGEGHFADQCKRFPDVESRKSRMNGRCYACLSTGHGVKNCTKSGACTHCGKTGHHRSLCYLKFGKPRSSGPELSLNVAGVSHQGSSVVNKSSSLLSHGETAILQTALAAVQGQGSIGNARIMFDTGCSRSFITRDLCNKIKARPRGTEHVSIAGFRDTKRRSETYDTVEFDVLLPDGGKQTLTANVTAHISCPIQKLPLDVKSNPALLTLNLAEPLISSAELVSIDILLGTDYYYDFIRCGRFEFPSGLIMLPSKLGFIATGRVRCDQGQSSVASSLKVDVWPSKESTLHIERFWSLEDIGIKTPSDSNTDDDEVLASFQKTVTFENHRYHVTLPFKPNVKELPSNRFIAEKRLESLFKRISDDHAVVTKYSETIEDQLSKGIIEKAPDVPTGEVVHYIPHHCVITPNKATTKLRIVYDASAKAGKSSPSLNDCLSRGPVMLDDLCGLLIRFRTHSIGLVSDIEKAFLQIGLQEEFRDATRFLWAKDITKPPVGDNVVVLRFCRVPFGYVCSPFHLAGVIKVHLQKSKLSVASDIDGNVYVDNVITGKNSVEGSKVFYEEAKQLFDGASMNLREWYSNSSDVMDSIKPADRGATTDTTVLGLKWDTENDTLSCNSFVVQEGSVNTKRLMLKYLAKVFDPCGFFSPVTVTGKMLIQQLWLDKYDWDDKLPANLVDSWMQCSSSLQAISSHPIPRFVKYDEAKGESVNHLHCFCDASGKAYAAVVYLVVQSGNHRTSNIVFAKSRVGPIKSLTIPRMELMAAVVGSRILAFVKSQINLSIADQYIWSDSQCVLHWIAKETVETTFIKNRVSEIKSHEGIQYRYVPTEVNPADLSSRGCSFEQLDNNNLWWHGPRWLVDGPSNWPPNPIPSSSPEQSTVDVPIAEDSSMLNVSHDSVDDNFRLSASNFSSLNRLLRVTAWVFRFINNIRRRRKRSGILVSSEIAEVQLYWDRRIQHKHFSNIIQGNGDAHTKQLKRQLDLFIDNVSIIRCGGRLQLANISEDAKHPKLLPKNEHYTDLVIVDCHNRLHHAGVSHTLSQLRYQYWVIHGRGQVKRVVKNCFICKSLHGGPFRYPDPPALPSFRVNEMKPFSAVGIDYMGPLYVINSGDSEPSKVWVCLFTCAVVRAIHLEVVESLSTEHFMMALRRFIGVHGTPDIIVSDNAKHFHKCDRHLHNIWSQIRGSDDVNNLSCTQGITWKFITELSPWMGGFYERMVGLVKTSLKKTLGNRFITLTEFQTIIVEVASIINSRPLVYNSSDVSDVPLSPSHFVGGPHRSLPSYNIDTDDYSPTNTTPDSLVTLWKRTQNTLQQFWNIWRNSYLLSLREHFNKPKQRNTNNTTPTIGTIVIIKDSLLRKSWRVGRIVALPVGRDGNCRAATVLLPSRKTLTRPLKLLYPLEVGTAPSTSLGTSSPPHQRRRTRRKAADVANQRIKECLDIVDSSSEADDNNSGDGESIQ